MQCSCPKCQMCKELTNLEFEKAMDTAKTNKKLLIALKKDFPDIALTKANEIPMSVVYMDAVYHKTMFLAKLSADVVRIDKDKVNATREEWREHYNRLLTELMFDSECTSANVMFISDMIKELEKRYTQAIEMTDRMHGGYVCEPDDCSNDDDEDDGLLADDYYDVTDIENTLSLTRRVDAYLRQPHYIEDVYKLDSPRHKYDCHVRFDPVSGEQIALWVFDVNGNCVREGDAHGGSRLFVNPAMNTYVVRPANEWAEHGWEYATRSSETST